MAIIVRHADKHIIEPARMNKKAGRAEVSGCRELRAEGGTPEAGRPELAPGGNKQGLGRGWAEAAGGQQEQGALVGRRRARAPVREGAGGRNGPHRAPEPARRPRHRLDPQADRVPRPAKGQLRRPASPRH